jgi:multiple sugar transport system permease protein
VKQRKQRRQLRQLSTAWLLLAPSLILYSLYVVFPILFTLYLSTTNWDGLSPQVVPMCLEGNSADSSGLFQVFSRCLGNYSELMTDPQFWTSLKNTVLWLIMYPIAAVVGLAFALFFHVKGTLVPLYKSMIFAPMVLSLVVVGTIWSWFLQPHFGLAEFVLKRAGLLGAGEEFSLMSSFDYASIGVIVAACWPHAAYCMVLYLAGLSNLQTNVIEAARIDGVNKWQLIWHVILPMLRPATVVVALVTFIGSMRAFDIIMVMTAGGPAGSTHVLASYMYEQTFQSFRYGYGAAVAVVLFLLSLGLIFAYLLHESAALRGASRKRAAGGDDAT